MMILSNVKSIEDPEIEIYGIFKGYTFVEKDEIFNLILKKTQFI
jgi:hypothetical protein